MQKIIVIGAGIIGAALASRLARDGAEVTVFDKADGAGGLATARSWAWLNASWGNAEPYHRLRVASLAEWRRLARDVAGVAPHWCGSLLWDLPADEMRRSMPVQDAWGYRVELVDGARALAIEPGLRAAPDVAIYAPDEGAIEPVEATHALIADAVSHGAVVRYGVEIERILEGSGGVSGAVLSDGTKVTADHVVLAGGVGTAELVAPLGHVLPMNAPPGLLAVTAPLDKVLNGLVVSPRAHVRQRADGSLIAGTDFAGADPGDDPEGVAKGIIEAVTKLLKPGAYIRLANYTVGHRPTPGDGVSIAGQVVQGLSVAATHSGVTLAPILARVLSDQILKGESDPVIAPFGPDRFH